MKTIALLPVLLTFFCLVAEGKKKPKVTTPKPTIAAPVCNKGDFAICAEEPDNKCICTIRGSQMAIDCQKQKLKSTSVCPDFSYKTANVTSIDVDLAHNDIDNIDNSMFNGFPHLVSNLDLGFNQIDEIDHNSFENLTNLVILDLHDNELDHIDEEMFIGLENLRELDLRDNHIVSISGNVFRHLKNLRRLFLDGNPLNTIDNLTFHHMSHLEILSMDNCSLEFLHEPWLKGLHSLHTLSLANNKFLVVPNFHGLSSLIKIVLSGNGFSEINDGQFSDLKSLKELWMVKMPNLWLVDSCGFCGLKKLTTLVLSDNPKLTRLEELAFGRDFKLKGLQNVDLRNNQLATLYPDTLPWGNISEIHLDGNPLNCDCSMKWIPSTNMKPFEPAYCVEPSSLKGKSIGDLTDYDFNCLTTQAKSRRFRGRLFAGMVALLSIAGLMSVIWFLCYGKYDCRSHLPWKSARGPIYAYRNLAMRTEDEPTGCNKDEEPLVPPTFTGIKPTDKQSLPIPVAL